MCAWPKTPEKPPGQLPRPNPQSASATVEAPIRIDTHLTPGAERSLADDVLDGLTRPFKELAPKHLYDSRGAQLFDRICELPEYYPTRAERAILQSCASTIAATTRAAELVELGSGTAAKTRVLLDAMAAEGNLRLYVPVDVTESMVRTSAEELVAEYPDLEVHGVVGDFERHLAELPAPRATRLVALLGGTLGNFTPGSRRRLLRAMAQLLGAGDHLLVGCDLVKDPAVIEAAYNDCEGVTAEFNRNLLHVINRELSADFVPERFAHVAFFDPRHEWVEMRLRSVTDQTVRVGALDLEVSFPAGEEMRTEISAKFTPKRLRGDLAAAGLALVEHYTDPQQTFALALARPSA